MADHTLFATFTGYQLRRAFFEPLRVDATVNPDPIFRYFYGITNLGNIR